MVIIRYLHFMCSVTSAKSGLSVSVSLRKKTAGEATEHGHLWEDFGTLLGRSEVAWSTESSAQLLHKGLSMVQGVRDRA